jgi:hypothetical protein
MSSVVFDGKKFLMAANSQQIVNRHKRQHLYNEALLRELVLFKVDVLVKSLSDPSNEIQNLNRFLEEIVASAL